MKPKKLLARVLAGHVNNVDFEDFARMVEAFGFEHDRTAGSHRQFAHPALPEVLSLQPHHGDAKPYQIRQLLALVESYNLTLEDEP